MRSFKVKIKADQRAVGAKLGSSRMIAAERPKDVNSNLEYRVEYERKVDGYSEYKRLSMIPTAGFLILDQ
jgi:hypothetical protein